MLLKNNKDLKILIKAAHAGGEVLREYFGKTLKVVEKSTVADYQTKADLESEKAILKILKKEFPKYNILSEEYGKINKNSDYTLAIDPLDGTNNFILGRPNFAVSVALLHGGKAILGVVYHPILDLTYYAKKGGGAYLNNKKIKVSNTTDPKKLTIGLGFGYKVNIKYFAEIMSAVCGSGFKRVMNDWSAAYDLCLLASGKIETFFVDGWEIHDFAACKLIAMEAGAKVIDLKGEEEKDYTNNKFIISNTYKINKYVLRIVQHLEI